MGQGERVRSGSDRQLLWLLRPSMQSWRAARPRAPWSVEECADFAARRQFKYVALLAQADERVVAMALRMQGVEIAMEIAFYTTMFQNVGVQHDASAAPGRDLRDDDAAASDWFCNGIHGVWLPTTEGEEPLVFFVLVYTCSVGYSD